MNLKGRLYCRTILPLLYYGRGDLRFRYFNKYKKNLSKSKREIQRYQMERLKKLVKHAYETVPYYTELFNKLGLKPGDIKSLKDLNRIPILTKSMVNNNLEKLKSTKKYKLVECTSGGSTGNRVAVFKDKRYEEISRAVFMRDLYSVGVNPGEKVAWVWSSPLENDRLKKSILRRIFWRLNRKIIFNRT